MNEVDAGLLLEQFHGEVMLAAVADRGVEQRRPRRTRQCDECLKILNRKRPLTVEMIHKINEAWGLPADILARPYRLDAIQEVGVVRGVILAAWRLLRCNPWSHGGVDHVSDRRIFKA